MKTEHKIKLYSLALLDILLVLFQSFQISQIAQATHIYKREIPQMYHIVFAFELQRFQVSNFVPSEDEKTETMQHC